ncbi:MULTISPECIES: hypothetical protein [Corallococcus]|uniref:hypothetical protein n=1 Tax=Corallococcus TaxID=83461 RepID=UPI000EF67DC9|nr:MULTISPECIES: hypothetical protein [Corallococcus]NNB91011.1 hypothetical protein [Corallococcus exiguus]NPC52052.1 hypothetical protein [Corallococcus exiguus]
MASRASWAFALCLGVLLWTGLPGVPGGAVAFATPPVAVAEAVDEKGPQGSGYREVVETAESFPQAGELGEGDLKATVRTATLVPSRGYTPIQVTVQNTGAQPRPVRLVIRSPQGRVTERSLELGPRERIVTWLLMPADLQTGQLSMESPGLYPSSKGFYLDGYRGSRVMVLGDVKAFEQATGLSRSQENMEPLVAARFVEPRTAPRELAAYAGYDAVLVAVPADQVPDDVWAVLETFAVTGGRLVLDQPPANPRLRFPLLQDEKAELSPYGFGSVRQFRACRTRVPGCGFSLWEDTERSSAVVVPAGPPPRWERHDLLSDGRLPLLLSARAPVGRFLLLIFLFVLAVGPGGWMLARRKGPLAVLIAVPTLAVLTSLGLVAWSVLVDGFSLHAARYSLTLLDRERSRAVTVGLNAWYANLAEESVRMPASSVLLAPESPEDPPRLLDWTNGLVVKNSFLPSRSYREWGEVAVVPSRARLTAHKTDGGVRVQNALGAPLKGGTLKLDGQRYVLPELADGAEGLAPPEEAEAGDADLLGLEHEPRMRFQDAVAPLIQELEDGTFVARLGGRGFTPTAALDVELEAALHVVRGQVEEARR